MIELKELKLKNFKSFKKAHIPMRKGMTVIVGANGAGKSNVQDSLLFALGTTSLKLLRANRLTDLVNHSTNEGYGKVELVIGNEEKNWSITRMIDAKGKSVYRLNEDRKTLNEIQSLLNELGIRNDGHNIVAQGDVAALIEKNPIQRREIIDDVSGIREFDEKKQEAENELLKVEEKIRETHIVLNERQNYLNKLEEERKAAMEFDKYMQRKKTLTASILHSEMEKLREQEETLRKKIITINEKVLEKEEKEKSIEKEEDEVRFKIEEINTHLLQESSRIYLQTVAHIEEKKSQRIVRNDSIQRSQEHIQKSQHRIRELSEKMNELNAALQALMNTQKQNEQELENARKEHENASQELGQLANEIERISETDKEKHAAIKEIEKILNELEKQHSQCPICERELGAEHRQKLQRKRHEEKKSHESQRQQLSIELKQLHAQREQLEHAIEEELRLKTSIQNTEEQIKSLQKVIERANYGPEITGLEKEIRDHEHSQKEQVAFIEKLGIELGELEKKVEKNQKENEQQMVKKNVFNEKLLELRKFKEEVRGKMNELKKQVNGLEVEKSKIEVRNADIREEFKEYSEVKTIRGDPKEFRQEVSELEKQIQKLGAINLKAMESFDVLKSEMDGIQIKVNKLEEEKKAVTELMQRIEDKRRQVFMNCYNVISKNFSDMFYNFFEGSGALELTDPNDPLNSGLIIKAQHKGTQLMRLESMSGGEKTLTALAFLFAIQLYEPMPFYVFDEADAALDKVNTAKLVKVLKEISKQTQLLVITHNDLMVQAADQMIGVALDKNNSSVIGLDLMEKTKEPKH